jgi:hypothetical protein
LASTHRGTGNDPGPDPILVFIAALPLLAALLNYFAAVIPLLL